MSEKRERAYKVLDVSERYGRPAWEYSDGSIRGEGGRLIETIPGGELITADNAREMAQRHRDAMRDAVVQGVIEGTGKATAPDAIQAVMAKRAEVAVSDTGRAGNDAARIVIDMLGLKAPDVSVTQVQHTIDDRTSVLLDAILSKQERAIIEGEVVQTSLDGAGGVD